MIDFDRIEDWAPKLTNALDGVLPKSIHSTLIEASPEYIEDACDFLMENSDKNAIIEKTIGWIASDKVLGYHGSRMNSEEVESVRQNGLHPLKATSRRVRLERALSPHPRWPEVGANLDDVIQKFGAGEHGGRRENQAHLTLSRTGLVNSFNHYPTYGSEFDMHVAYDLLGNDGKELLKKDGDPRVACFAVPGIVALDTAHPTFSISDLRERGDLPNIVDKFISYYSYRLAYPDFTPRAKGVDCGMVFRSVVPSEWLMEIEDL